MHKCHCYLSNLWCKWAARIFSVSVSAHCVQQASKVCILFFSRLKGDEEKKHPRRRSKQEKKKMHTTQSLAVLTVIHSWLFLLFCFLVACSSCISILLNLFVVYCSSSCTKLRHIKMSRDAILCLLCVHTAVSYFYFHQFLVCIRYVGRRGTHITSYVFLIFSCFIFFRCFVFSRSLSRSLLSLTHQFKPIQSNPIDQRWARCVYMSFLNFLWHFFLSLLFCFAPLS